MKATLHLLALALTALAATACQQPSTHSFPALTIAGRDLQGPVAESTEWRYTRTDTAAPFTGGIVRRLTFDTQGRLREQWEWRDGKPHLHLRQALDSAGRPIHHDIRLTGGQPGGHRTFTGDSTRAISETFDSQGAPIEQVERITDPQGRIIRRSQVMYTRQGGSAVQAYRLSWETTYGPGDTIRETQRRDGNTIRQTLRTAGRTIEDIQRDKAGQVQELGRPVPTGHPGETAFAWFDGAGTMIRMELEQALGGTQIRELRTFGSDGALTSLDIQLYDHRGRIIEQRSWAPSPGGQHATMPATRYHYQDDPQGNWIQRVERQGTHTTAVTARQITYHPQPPAP